MKNINLAVLFVINMRRQNHAKILRITRKIHRWTGVSLFLLFFIMSTTGIFLGWKKYSFGSIHPGTAEGSSPLSKEWLSLDSIRNIAENKIVQLSQGELGGTVARLDVRPEKGTVKAIFREHYYGIQIDGRTRKVLQLKKRNQDLIEDLHDGSMLDDLLGTGSDFFKLLYTSLMGFALTIFTVTGFWLGYGPKMMRNSPH